MHRPCSRLSFLSLTFCRGQQDLDYKSPHVLGLAATWPQAACSLPRPHPESPDFDWEGDQPLHLPMEDLIIYEMHVRGFTRDESSGVAAPGKSGSWLQAGLRPMLAMTSLDCGHTAGTYKGLVEKLDYIQKLGVNSIELLPVHEFNELEYYQVARAKTILSETIKFIPGMLML